MNFQFARESEFTSDIEIESIGNCAIEAVCFDGRLCTNLVSYIVVTTSIGTTNILQFGPYYFDSDGIDLQIDTENLPNNSSITFTRFEYSEKKIYKAISNFLNVLPNKQAREVDIDYALSKCIDLVAYIQNQEVKRI